jgi:hypothetical protein
MTTITLDLPEDLAATLNAVPESERNHFAVALMREGLVAWDESVRDPSHVPELTPEEIRRRDEILTALSALGSNVPDTAGSVSLESMRRAHLYTEDR